MYAVIDLETTGLRAAWHDRVCEIAIVAVDRTGEITDEWCSLVNPDRDLGPQFVHGISAAEARQAPRFADLAGQIVARLAGRVVVAHNLVFDLGFLRAELAKLGYPAPLRADEGLCTMRLASRFLPYAGRRLQDCCLAADIEIENAHSARDDARAAAQLLGYYLRHTDLSTWDDLGRAAAATPWPALPDTGAAPVQRRRRDSTREHFLGRLVDRLPRVPAPPAADSYLSVLDRALIDRHISETEAETLVELAETLGLGRAEVLGLHRRYLDALTAEALDDGVLTASEHADLVAVARLLGLTEAEVAGSVAVVGSRGPDPATAALGRRLRLAAGDIVVFTGQAEEPRDVWERRAAEAGLAVGRNVTKRTSVVVAADPDSLSGKARLARRYQVPIIRPRDFLHHLDTPA